MECTVFYDPQTRACVVVCKHAAAAHLGLVVDDDGHPWLIATDGGELLHGVRLLIGHLPPSVQQCQIVDLGRPTAPRTTVTLTTSPGLAAGPGGDTEWRLAAFAPRRRGDDSPFQLHEDLKPELGIDDLRQSFLTQCDEEDLDLTQAWSVASMASKTRADPVTLIWPTPPTLLVEIVEGERELPRFKPEKGPALLLRAYEPRVGVPILSLSTNQPFDIAAAGQLTIICMAHQIRFFQDKDKFLNETNQPDTGLINISKTLLNENNSEVGFDSTLSVRWVAGQHYENPDDSQFIEIDIDHSGHNATLTYSQGAVGDDVYLLAEQPLFVGPRSDVSQNILGFRVTPRGFELLDLAAPDVAPYASRARTYASKQRLRRLNFDDARRRKVVRGPSPGNPLAGFLELAFAEVQERLGALDYDMFAQSPAAWREQTQWGRPVELQQISKEASLAVLLARAAGLETELTEASDIAQQWAVLRLLRNGDRVDLLRRVRITLPVTDDDIEKAIGVAEALLNPRELELWERIADELNEHDLQARFRQFRTRPQGVWTALADAARLKDAIDEFRQDDPDITLDDAKPEDGASPLSRAEQISAFEAQLAAAAATENVDKAQLARIRKRYEDLKSSNRLDTHLALPRLRGRLDRLTTGPILDSNFKEAIAALEGWARLPNLSRLLFREDEQPRLATDWSAVINRLRPPPHLDRPNDLVWNDVRRMFLEHVKHDWRDFNRNLRSDEIAGRGTIIESYADALLHHHVYTSIASKKDAIEHAGNNEGVATQLINAIQNWPGGAGEVWNVAWSLFPESELNDLTTPPTLFPHASV